MYLLYPNTEPDNSFRNDEKTAETLKSLGVGRLLAVEERDLAPLLSADPTVIRRRQALFQDLDGKPELTEILSRLHEYLKNIREMAQKRAGLGQTAEDVLYSFGEVSLFIGMIRDISEVLEAAEPASDALKELSALLHEIAADPQFAEIEDYVAKLAESRNVARSITLGVNLDAGFGVKEVGVVSVNDDRYTVSDLFTAILGKKRQDGALVCMTPLVGGEKTRGLEQAVYIALNSYLLKAFVRARTVLLGYISSVISGVTLLMDELTFILRGADWMKDLRDRGAAFCFPETGGRMLRMKGCWNPALLKKTDYMKMDTGGFMSNMVLFLVPAILFGAVQGFLSFKTHGRQIQMIPLALSIGGLLFCLAVYLGLFGSGSPSVVAENRYFAMFLCIPVSGAFVGCLAGMVIAKFLRK